VGFGFGKAGGVEGRRTLSAWSLWQTQPPHPMQVALMSARDRAPSLVPVLMFSGPEDHPMPRLFRALGGHVVPHTLSFIEAMQREPQDRSNFLLKLQGTWMK
jgi:hypothetical protein